MLEWHIHFLIKGANGRTAWREIAIRSKSGNKHAVAHEYKAAHPEVVGIDFGLAWSRWL